jgi:hypothetical protein
MWTSYPTKRLDYMQLLRMQTPKGSRVGQMQTQRQTQPATLQQVITLQLTCPTTQELLQLALSSASTKGIEASRTRELTQDHPAEEVTHPRKKLKTTIDAPSSATATTDAPSSADLILILMMSLLLQ